MRAALAVTLLLAGALLSGCGGGSSSPANVLPPVGSNAPVSITETPLSALAFDDSVGVNTHMTYVASPYDTGFSVWSPILASSGIKHVRDAICPSNIALAWCVNTESARVNQLASSGIKFDLLTFMSDSFTYVQNYAQTMGVGGAIEAYEGPNECDAGYCGSSWQSIEAAWQQQLYGLKAPGVAIIAPSMTTSAGYAALGNLAAFAQFGNIHDYPAANEPEGTMPAHLQWAAQMTGQDPVLCTEDGYNTDPTYANNGVPQVVQERYLPRLLLEHLRLGVARTYIYQLFDFGGDGGSNMGLLNADYTPKPAWTTLLHVMQLFSDSAPAPRTPLTYAISGDSSGTLDHVLFQRSDGTYMLALWLEQPVYDASSHSVLPIAGETLTLALPATAATATLVAFGDNGAETTGTLSAAGGVFEVPVRSMVSVLEFRP